MQKYRLEKIVVSAGLGRMRQNPQFEDKILPEITREISGIVGQRVAPCRARKSIASFKVREGDVIGVVATLRGKRMQDFFDKVVHIALPRVRDFRGIDLKQFDDRGNVTIGFKDHTIFPEVNPEKSHTTFGLEVTMVASTTSKEEGIEFFRSLGLPLKKND
ncbi:MAG: 50S ribosomal protein L5 [bacterium]